LTDKAPERNFIRTTRKRCFLRGPLPGILCSSRRQRTSRSRWARALALTLMLGVCGRSPAQSLVLLVQSPVWAQPAGRFDARPFARQLSIALGQRVVVRRSEDVLSHWRAVRSGRGFELAFDEAHFTAYRVSHHGFTVLAQAESDVRFAIVVRPRTLITAPSDLSARKVAAPAPPALAALRLLNLFPDIVHAPRLVMVAGQEQALLALSAGEVDAAILPMEAAESLPGLQIALETDATPGRAFSVSAAISPRQRRELLNAFRELGASAQGRRVFAGFGVTRLEPVANSVYEDSEQLLKGTWGY